MSAPVLISPNFDKDFYIFSFASEDTIAAVLLQKNDEGHEQPVAFFSKVLRDAEVKYESLEKQAYALIKALKAFRTYILQAKVIAYVPSSSVKDVLIQPDIDGKRSKWITKLIEFDIEIKPVKRVRGQGLANLLVEDNCKLIEMNMINCVAESSEIPAHESNPGLPVSNHIAECEWYSHIIYFLQNLEPPADLSKTQKRVLKLKGVNFCINENMLFWKDPM